MKRILRSAVQNFPRRHVVAIACVTTGIGLVLAFLPGEDAQAKRTEIPLTLSSIEDDGREVILQTISDTTLNTDQLQTVSQALAKTPAEPVIAWEKVKVRSGDTLSDIFSRQSLSAGTLHRILNSTDHGRLLTRIRPGQFINFGRVDGKLNELKYVQNRLESVVYSVNENVYSSKKVIREPEIRRAYARATIDNSLFLAATKAGLPDNMTMRLANIFGWDIDFVMDIRKGDSFNMVYEEKYLDGERIGYGDILAATFTNRDKVLEAVYYTDNKGNSDYYTPSGKSMRKSFIRTPVDFTRISSPFNPNRLHPIFKTKRPHRGVDYAAPTGTPIKAAGDGVVKLAGRQKGYGNVVIIKHPNNIETLYAHQSRIARSLKKGQRVKQGQTIGYVGQTGWATGPHLHYEFRVSGRHRNPLTVKLPEAQPLPKSEMANFRQITRVMLAELERYSGTLLAAAESDLNNGTN
ncbi:peptidoglycan DD-metalloendopeptidase family protein [Sansalvadorimonas sp. 2012CJ34-2]|uniref:Peptidoglycan DD-metalloendopeptidase family protein n=1 Tax=Parendozoicomonas callyspongiae TaxID=2942213 RepID=A0ABT0PJ33_9GAMM|nr:peptidoglycan DD-metalloendopeptidase family protein [Sansalvadorimonas sp. 2012CJ34-2]MCL6270493.1 peptidoglycan DD-metalloendopeptidase family protein [Sansalvadorimonas sp. 2012CJ34-2]